MAGVYEGYSTEEPNGEKKIRDVHKEVLKARFLELYMVTGHVQNTCKILGIVPRTFYHWKTYDDEFKAELKIAEEIALSMLEDEAYRRAAIGIEKPVYQGGKLVGTVIEYSDQLLITLLKARNPNKYRERFAGELTGPNGQPLLNDVKITHIHTGLNLANSEEQIILDKSKPVIQDIEHEDVPPASTDKQLDEL